MDILCLVQTDSRYPPALKMYPHDDMPASIAALGDLDILDFRSFPNFGSLALFSSIKYPGNLILQIYDLAQDPRQAGVAVIGGFHSPMERKVLTILLRGQQPVIVCPARNSGVRMAREYAEPIEQGRLLILSPFDEKQQRITAEISTARNRFVAALADAVFVAHAEPGGKLETLCREVIAWGKPLYTLEGDANAPLTALGARTMNIDMAIRSFVGRQFPFGLEQ